MDLVSVGTFTTVVAGRDAITVALAAHVGTAERVTTLGETESSVDEATQDGGGKPWAGAPDWTAGASEGDAPPEAPAGLN